jgi:hypothetical protein
MPDRRYYRPVSRGLEIKIGEALARLRAKAPPVAAEPNSLNTTRPPTANK